MPHHYRVGEYQLSDLGGTELRWEAHAGFATIQEGRCYILDEVLLIGPPQIEEPGAFKGDFLDSLKRFPIWEKTRFYCVNACLFRCSDGRCLTWEEVAALAAITALNRNSTERPDKVLDDLLVGNFRLGTYEIFRKNDGSLRWQGHPGSKNIKEGKAFLLGDLLFLAPGMQKAYPKGREEFNRRITLLPPWKATTYFVIHMMLRECQKPIDGMRGRHMHAPEIVAGHIYDADKGIWETAKIFTQNICKGLVALWQWLLRRWGRRGD